ncbi:MAG: hypothetical protein KatS3mg086_067 [Candidatus Dojkabacteria bacterium]|nr:MAG: hypothetical protein KatS3mg086_067 [Candidatus Dojkabacteria bacterium]
MKQREIIFDKENIEFEINEDSDIVSRLKLSGTDSIKANLKFIHNKPYTKSRINIKAVLFDEARLDIEGMLVINSNANQTDTYLKMDCLIMSKNAYARLVPGLEIKASEVKGGHGATIGYIDLELLNYLQSRGLNQKTCENLIVDAFLQK